MKRDHEPWTTKGEGICVSCLRYSCHWRPFLRSYYFRLVALWKCAYPRERKRSFDDCFQVVAVVNSPCSQKLCLFRKADFLIVHNVKLKRLYYTFWFDEAEMLNFAEYSEQDFMPRQSTRYGLQLSLPKHWTFPVWFSWCKMRIKFDWANNFNV